MTAHDHRGLSNWASRLSPVLLCVGLVLFHAINNWIWLTKNVAPRGWDRINALVNSLLYYDTLSPLTFHALFKASIQDEVRPPLFAASMALMYKLFGVSPDVAAMVNVVYLALLVAASYGVGKKLGGRGLGLLGACLALAFPLVYSMSRYSYFEFALTALVVLSIYFLLSSDRFQNRRNSLLLGLVLGLGALLKRTYAVFVVGAVLAVVLQARLLPRLWTWLRAGPRPHWRHLGLAVGGGLLLSALWYWPNRDLTPALPAGPWLFPVWWGLAATTIYFLLLPPSVETNSLVCGALGVSLASLWYVPHCDFVQRVLRAGWGVNDPRGRTVNLLTFLEYLHSILSGVSLAYIVLLLLAAALLLFTLIRRRPRLALHRWLCSNWLVIAAAVIVPYVILSTSIYHEDRAITPILPFLGMILAAMLLKLPWRSWRAVLISLAIVFGLVQFFAVSYTEAHWLVDKTRFQTPLLGQRGLFAQGPYVEVPDSGLNDPGFWIADDVLQRVEAARQRQGWETISLGVMAWSDHVHAGMFAYDQILHYPAIRLENPLQTYPIDSPYSIAFRYDYLVLLERGNRGKTIREGVHLILNERRSFFEQAFELETLYHLPDGDTAYLFRRRYRPTQADDTGALYEVAQYLSQETAAEDLLVVASPGLLDKLLEAYWGPAPLVVAADSQAVSQEVACVSGQHSRLFLLAGRDVDMDQVSRDLLPDLVAPAQEFQFGELRLAILETTCP